MEDSMKQDFNLDIDGESNTDSLAGDTEDLNALKARLIQMGVDVTSPTISSEVEKRTSQINTKHSKDRKRPEWYGTLRNSFLAWQDVLGIMFYGAIMLVIAPLSLLALVYTEGISVYLGLSVFLSDEPTVASILSITVVLSYVVVGWIMSDVLRRIPHEDSHEWSLKLFMRNVAYRLGFGSGWEARKLHVDFVHLKRLNSVHWWLIIIIVIMGFLGRLKSDLANYDDVTWHEAIIQIATNSNVTDFISYVGGAAIAIALLVGTQFMIEFFYGNYYRAVGSTEVDFLEDGDIQRETDKNIAEYYLFLIQKKQVADRGKVKTPNLLELGVATPPTLPPTQPALPISAGTDSLSETLA
jgi:hypothetical protein